MKNQNKIALNPAQKCSQTKCIEITTITMKNQNKIALNLAQIGV